MFAVLAHTVGDGTHWDFLIEVPDLERLPTWRLAADPCTATVAIGAERIGDHRAVYLDYEGEIAGDRGVVSRVERGAARVLVFEGERLVAEVAGEVLRGRVEIARDGDGVLRFRCGA